ncbi:DUF2283 domain-containing protein [Candidatus Micrarchaeota archaeon]|nr:DUF2283 domain-containing protein [Candidatus Micrarchaeota archaeon]
MNSPIDYDAQSDSLYVTISGKRAYITAEISPRIGVDLTQDGQVVGVGILDASTIISDLFGRKVSKINIKHLLCSIKQDDAVYLNFELENQRASLALPKAYQSPVLNL